MRLKILTGVVLAILISGTLQAQFSLGINVKVQDPTGDFNHNVHKAAAGISFTGIHRKVDSRFSWGGELGIAMYSNENYLYDLSEDGYPGEFVEVSEEDCFWTLHALARYHIWEKENVKTYAEGRLGVTTFFSSRTALDDHYDIDDNFDSHGTAFNTGLGAGLAFNPKGVLSKDTSGRLWIELGATYMTGTKANYRHISESASGLSLSEGQYRSLTHYMDYRLGFVFSL